MARAAWQLLLTAEPAPDGKHLAMYRHSAEAAPGPGKWTRDATPKQGGPLQRRNLPSFAVPTATTAGKMIWFLPSLVVPCGLLGGMGSTPRYALLTSL
jgi:hypothetical protein